MKSRRPLDPHYFHALLATARVCGVTMAAGALACAGGEAESTPASPAPQQPAAVAEAAPEATSPTQEAMYGTAATPVEKSPEEKLAACTAMTAAAFKDQKDLAPGRKVDPEVLECCKTIAAHYDAQNLEGMEKWNERMSCCSALEWQSGGMACTPWGPTAPPVAGNERPRLDAAHTLDLAARARLAWSGRVTPAPSVAIQRAEIETWRGRMLNEWVSARVFGQIAQQMVRAGFGPHTVQTWTAFADEERRHGSLCGAVVQRLGGEARAPRPALPAVPQHADVDARQAVLRNVLSVSCLSETVAVALIGAEREAMPAGELRELLTEIYADEVGHASAGWRLLRSELSEAKDPDGARRADLRAYLPVALADLYAHELEHLPASFVAPPGGEQWGLCSGVGARRLLSATVQSVIGPGLAELLAA